jgi:formylmethanofuran dehydrogenase subunit E
MSSALTEMLERSASRHDHLCPRQVLGVRMGLAGLEALGLESPVSTSAGLVIVESDGCFVDGLEIATGATVGHRTLAVRDLGKIAATFASIRTGRALRLAPCLDVRERASLYASGAGDRYSAQLEGYQRMPAVELFHVQEVSLDPPLASLLSRPEARAICKSCGEEIINDREVIVGDLTICKSCAGRTYYQPTGASTQVSPLPYSCNLSNGGRHEPVAQALSGVSPRVSSRLRYV